MTSNTGYQAHFTDNISYEPERKQAISVRDGVLEYLGAELGLEPADRVFTVFRSPATIAKAALLMDGIPLTNDHVSPDVPIDAPIGRVVSSTVVDFFDAGTDSRLGVANELELDDGAAVALAEGKRQLSLGYGGKLYEHDTYDYEQRDIEPHHLAAVLAGRCGPSCSFLDAKPPTTKEVKDMAKDKPTQGQLLAVFLDAEGQPNLEQIAEIAVALPEAMKKLPIDKLTEILPVLQEVVAAAGSAGGMDKEMGVEPEAEVTDADEPAEQEPEVEVEDMKMEDSAAFRDAVSSAVKDHATVSAKAVKLLGKDYAFADKDAAAIMRDCVAAQYPDATFADSELRVAFKMLKPVGTDVSTFGDGDPTAGKFQQLKDKEV